MRWLDFLAAGRGEPMPHLIWLPEALRDIEHLHDVISEKMPTSGAQWGVAYSGDCAPAGGFPGNPQAEGGRSGRREVFAAFGAGSDVLRYRLAESGPVVIRVWYSREWREE